MITIRNEKPEDVSRISSVHERAFGQSEEAGIVDELRRTCRDYISLVAEEEGEIVGHILFTPATAPGPRGRVTGMGMAPISVIPERQGRGIGSQLIERGLEMLRERECPFVVVLGHPGYYPKFGFERASAWGLECQWKGVPDEAFMILVMDPEAIEGVSGVVEYREEFSAVV